MANLYYWRGGKPNWKDGKINYGDALSPVVVAGVLGEEVTRVVRCKTDKLLAIGSILWALRPGDTVYGTGVHPTNENPYDAIPSGVRFVCVRGPYTRDAILRRGGDAPKQYLDPARLLPRFYTPFDARHGKTALIPHFRDEWGQAFAAISRRDTIHVDILQDWKKTTDAIAGARLVVSSSLHALIVAEAYGVPAIWTIGKEGYLKYEDYYLGTARNVRATRWEDSLLRTATSPPLPSPDFPDYVTELRQCLTAS